MVTDVVIGPLRSPSQSDSELGDKGEQDKEGMMVARSQISMGTPPGGPYSLLTRPFVSRLTLLKPPPSYGRSERPSSSALALALGFTGG